VYVVARPPSISLSHAIIFTSLIYQALREQQNLFENLKAGAVAGFDESLLNICLPILGWVFGFYFGWFTAGQLFDYRFRKSKML